MKNFLLAPILATTILVGTASAATVEMDMPGDIQAPRPTLTRAEVAADLQVRRLAGLQDLYRGDVSPDTNSAQYRRALATYQYLRSSPQFGVLVQKLEENPNTTVVARRPSGLVAQSSR